MKSLLPLIALALIGGCGADFPSHFRLPPFRLFDKNNDGSFTEDEAGKLMVDAARVMTQLAGKKLFAGFAYLPPFAQARDGKLTKEEYKQIEDTIRVTARQVLEKIKVESKQWQEQIAIHAREFLRQFIVKAEETLQNGLDEMEDQRPTFEMAIAKIEKYFEEPKA